MPLEMADQPDKRLLDDVLRFASIFQLARDIGQQRSMVPRNQQLERFLVAGGHSLGQQRVRYHDVSSPFAFLLFLFYADPTFPLPNQPDGKGKQDQRCNQQTDPILRKGIGFFQITCV
ncbi:hypothetical protein D3C81_1007010 [compost metagenome]